MVKQTEKEQWSIKGDSTVPLISDKLPQGGLKVICRMEALALFICEMYLLKYMSPKMVTYHHFSKASLNPNILT